MKILVVGIVNNPQIDRLKDEAKKKSHTLDACYTADLVISSEDGSFVPEVRGNKLSDYDLIYLLTLGKRRWVWYAACEYLKEKGTVIVNGAVTDPSFNFNPNVAKELYLQIKDIIPIPKTAVALSAKSAVMLSGDFNYPFIVKSGEGRQGKSVFKVSSLEELKNVALTFEEDKLTIVLREYIANDGDIRIFTVGYKAIGAMKRTPKKGEFRSNISRGGKGEFFDLEKYPDIKALAEKAALVCRVEIAGVDIIIDKETGNPYVLEVNPGPQFAGLEKYTGLNAAGEIIKYFEKVFTTSIQL